jgi:hypothetical protein
MNREDLASGLSFRYSGPLSSLRQAGTLRFLNNTLVDRKDQVFAKASLTFSDYFFIDHPIEGKQFITLQYCQLTPNS